VALRLGGAAGIYLLSDGLAVGDWLTVACAAFWALQIIFINRVAIRSGRPIMLALVQFIVCGVLGMIVAVGTEPTEPFSIVAAAPEILFAGIFSSGIAFTLQAVGQRFTTAPQAAIMLSSEAVFAALFGALMLGERMSFQGTIGCSLIFFAMITVELVPALRKRAEVRP
jgi:drug/metabolite transporter (DMT)-like permease